MKGIEVSSYDRAKIRELHRNGASARDLAQKYELHLATIYRLIREKEEQRKEEMEENRGKGKRRSYIVLAEEGGGGERERERASEVFTSPLHTEYLRHCG